jgi:hypothetical protein
MISHTHTHRCPPLPTTKGLVSQEGASDDREHHTDTLRHQTYDEHPLCMHSCKMTPSTHQGDGSAEPRVNRRNENPEGAAIGSCNEGTIVTLRKDDGHPPRGSGRQTTDLATSNTDLVALRGSGRCPHTSRLRHHEGDEVPTCAIEPQQHQQ